MILGKNMPPKSYFEEISKWNFFLKTDARSLISSHSDLRAVIYKFIHQIFEFFSFDHFIAIFGIFLPFFGVFFYKKCRNVAKNYFIKNLMDNFFKVH